MFVRTVNRFRSALLGAVAAALVLTTATALAGSGVGGVFNLGVANSVDQQTSLTGNPGGNPLLKVSSTGTAAAVRGVAVNGIGTNGISTSGVGQQGLSDSGIGTLGTHGNTTGVSPGVQGETNSTDANGAGVVGKNNGGGPGLKAIVNAGAPPLAVNSSVKVANLNADLLDGLDSPAFQRRVTGTCATGSAVKTVNADGTVVCEPVGGGLWSLTGNAGTTPGTNFLGTTDNQPLELKVHGQRGLQLEPGSVSPNLIGGSSANQVKDGASGVTIGGGGSSASPGPNIAYDNNDTIGGGEANVAGVADGLSGTARYATVAGGYNGAASAEYSVIGGGRSNTATGAQSTVAGGSSNSAVSLNDTVSGGAQNVASGGYSVVAGGFSNTASGLASFAAGNQAKATQNGSFVWGDSTIGDVTSPAANTFTVRASGGIWLGTNSSPAITAGHFIDTSTGAYLTGSGTWTNSSDRAKKHDLRPLNDQSVLDKVARMPVTSWSYKAEQPSIRHIGPMAQDFYTAFGLGLDNKHITTIDEGGVALAAIKGLYRQNRALERQNQAVERQNRALDRRLTRLERVVAGLKR